MLTLALDCDVRGSVGTKGRVSLPRAATRGLAMAAIRTGALLAAAAPPLVLYPPTRALPVQPADLRLPTRLPPGPPRRRRHRSRPPAPPPQPHPEPRRGDPPGPGGRSPARGSRGPAQPASRRRSTRPRPRARPAWRPPALQPPAAPSPAAAF